MKAHTRLDKFPGKKGSTVRVNNGNINGAITILKKRNNEEGLAKELRDREFFMTKRQRARRDKAAAIRRYKKAALEQKQLDSMGGSF